MKWIIQEMLNNSNTRRFEEALNKLGVDYLVINILADNFKVLNKLTRVPEENSEEIIEEFCKNSEVMLYGSKKLMDLKFIYNLNPGHLLNDNFEYKNLERIFSNLLLNNNVVEGFLNDLEPIGEEFFIRPSGNTKLFTGYTITKNAFISLQESEKIKPDSPYLYEKVILSEVKDIYSEYRFFIYNNEIVGSSSYMSSGKLCTDLDISEDIYNYVEYVINNYSISKGYVLDVCKCSEGIKIVEVNNLNTSGLYGVNEYKLIEKIK